MNIEEQYTRICTQNGATMATIWVKKTQCWCCVCVTRNYFYGRRYSSTPTMEEATTANTDITQLVSTSVVQADKQTNEEQNAAENTSSNSQKEQQLVNKTSDESTDQLNNKKNQELVKDNEYESITNLNKNNVNTQNTPVEESKVSQSATEQNARIDLTFVDDDDNGKIVDYSEYLPSEDNGHHYAYGKVGDKVSPKAYNK